MTYDVEDDVSAPRWGDSECSEGPTFRKAGEYHIECVGTFLCVRVSVCRYGEMSVTVSCLVA